MHHDGTAVAANERVLKSICQQLVYHKPCRHGDIHGNRIGVHLQIKPNPFTRMRAQHRGRNLTNIKAKVDLAFRPVLDECRVKQLDRFNTPS